LSTPLEIFNKTTTSIVKAAGDFAERQTIRKAHSRISNGVNFANPVVKFDYLQKDFSQKNLVKFPLRGKKQSSLDFSNFEICQTARWYEDKVTIYMLC